jgi:hypothetical protein
MSSKLQIEANRHNSRKSRGPRSAAGKSLASRNALRHGLSALTNRPRVPAEDLDRFARAFCGSDADPALVEHARIIANQGVVLRAITAQQLAVAERVREPSAIALARGDNSIKLMKARSRQSREAYDALIRLRDHLLDKYKGQLAPPTPKHIADSLPPIELFIPWQLEDFLQQREADSIPQASQQSGVRFQEEWIDRERDESAALTEAARDLIRLDRYEQRIWSQQKRAIRAFMNIKLLRKVNAPQADQTIRRDPVPTD